MVLRSSSKAGGVSAILCGVVRMNPPCAQIRHADIISVANIRLAKSGADWISDSNLAAASLKFPATMVARASL